MYLNYDMHPLDWNFLLVTANKWERQRSVYFVCDSCAVICRDRTSICNGNLHKWWKLPRRGQHIALPPPHTSTTHPRAFHQVMGSGMWSPFLHWPCPYVAIPTPFHSAPVARIRYPANTRAEDVCCPRRGMGEAVPIGWVQLSCSLGIAMPSSSAIKTAHLKVL